MQVLAALGVSAHRVRGAPGVYVRQAAPFDHAPLPPAHSGFEGLAKIAAIGVKLSNHCTLHGLALNVHMDLRPFASIDPCGYPGLHTTDLAHLGVQVGWQEVAERLAERLQAQLAA
jgi:lipoyl(octanoyl) transferase